MLIAMGMPVSEELSFEEIDRPIGWRSTVWRWTLISCTGELSLKR